MKIGIFCTCGFCGNTFMSEFDTEKMIWNRVLINGSTENYMCDFRCPACGNRIFGTLIVDELSHKTAVVGLSDAVNGSCTDSKMECMLHNRL